MRVSLHTIIKRFYQESLLDFDFDTFIFFSVSRNISHAWYFGHSFFPPKLASSFVDHFLFLQSHILIDTTWTPLKDLKNFKASLSLIFLDVKFFACWLFTHLPIEIRIFFSSNKWPPWGYHYLCVLPFPKPKPVTERNEWTSPSPFTESV